MEYPKKIQDLLNKAKDFTGMSMTDFYAEIDKLVLKAVPLVKEKIKGERKGLPGELNYLHSMRINEIVSRLHHWDDPDVEMFLGALLHDIIEDGEVTFEELVDMGFTKKTIELIYLCTHDKTIENKTERWTLMIATLIEARNEEAWCIKLIDLSDNLTQCSGLTEDNRKFMIEVKAPLMLRLTESLDNRYSRPYRAYLEETLEKVKSNIT
jgi:(p)ppGpp synthase/HD superfamily hydrolase